MRRTGTRTGHGTAGRAARTPLRALGVVTALGAVLTASACGSGAGGEQTAADEKQTLTVWAMGAEGEKLAEVADAYEKKNPHIKVKVTPIGWDVAHQKLVAAAAGGNLPDMAQMGTTFMGEFAQLDALEPVDTKVFDKGDFFPAAWENNVVDDQVYGVPWYVDTRVLYYRTDLAKKAGVDQAPRNWKDLAKLATAYQKDADTRWGVSLQPSGLDTWQNWLPFLYSAGGELLDKDGKPALDSPQSVKALKEYGSYFDKGLAKKSVQPGYDVVKDFGKGTVPMFFSGPWQMTNIAENQPKLKGKWKAAAVPADASSTSFAAGANLVTFKDSPHKAAAKEFTRYLTSTTQQVDWNKRTNNLPANKAAWKAGDLTRSADLRVFRAQMDSAKPVPAIAKWAEFGARVDQAVADVTQGKASPRQAAAKMQKATAGLVD
ncbi:sugar ABC transporter substrate-binding protein [Streptomyces sp. NPDC005438]|uniref:sugar ABC transporter substrate-binding protein n=1 Tax=Streptomyces sp. NPDC005438 TaxID=3156880 RepID=UPI0033B50C59